MKFLSVLVFSSLISTSAFSQVSSAVALGATGIVGAASLTSLVVPGCEMGAGSRCPVDENLGLTLAYGAGILTTVVVALPKEDQKVLKSDAILFVAGFEKTDFLSIFLDSIRMENPELEKYSDEEMALVLSSKIK